MAISMFIKDTMGMEADPVGILTQNYPNFIPNSSFGPQITAGTGKFEGQGLSVNRAISSSSSLCFQREFQSSGVIIRTVPTTAADNNQKTLFEWSGWIRIDTVSASLTSARQILSLNTSLNPGGTGLVLMGLINTADAGLNLVFPTSYTSWTTAPVMVAVQTGIYYFVTIRLAGPTVADEINTSVTVSGAVIRDNAPTTYTSGYFTVAQTINRWSLYTSSLYTYTLDDCSIQQVDGTSVDKEDNLLWPAGFTDGVANAPTNGANDMPLMPPVRSYKVPVNANGSINQWASSNPGVPNWQAVSNGIDYVEASDSGQIDLYKFDPATSPTMTGIKAVQITETSDKYLSIKPQLKFAASDTGTQNFDVVNKGFNRITALVEEGATEAFTPATLATLEVGNQSL